MALLPRLRRQPTSAPPAATNATDKPAERSITCRSLLVGTLCVIAVCAGTPFNDLILSDTSLVAGFLPLAAVLLPFLARRRRQRAAAPLGAAHALRRGELAIVLLMTLVSCGIPNWGLMRFLAPTPVAPFHLGACDERFWNAFAGMNLPGWLFPVDNVADGRTDPTATWFYTRVPRGENIPWTRVDHAAARLGHLRRRDARDARRDRPARSSQQWMTNERLPFPLVQVQAALIESPAPGFALNKLFRSPLLWIALGGVFAILMLSCLNAYFPRYFPTIPLKYDFRGILSEEPLSLPARQGEEGGGLVHGDRRHVLHPLARGVQPVGDVSAWSTSSTCSRACGRARFRRRRLAGPAPRRVHRVRRRDPLDRPASLAAHPAQRRSAAGGDDGRTDATFWIAVIGIARDARVAVRRRRAGRGWRR